jgi:hypothetical protein
MNARGFFLYQYHSLGDTTRDGVIFPTPHIMLARQTWRGSTILLDDAVRGVLLPSRIPPRQSCPFLSPMEAPQGSRRVLPILAVRKPYWDEYQIAKSPAFQTYLGPVCELFFCDESAWGGPSQVANWWWFAALTFVPDRGP